MAMGFRKERHSITNLQMHLICVTKYRQKILTLTSLRSIENSFREVAKKMNFEIREFNGEADHVHIMIELCSRYAKEYPPKLSISQIVNSLKGLSSRRYGENGYPKPNGKTALWSSSYFTASVGGASIEVLKEYINNQKKPS
ncbi:MAG: IS200/IS605 family transposase [Moorea sp. SIO4G2]|uniref:IS200/IS605 family transposase n=1 Tax=Moorena sp. SIO3I6 TaxID=2607831 RepID=UPI0013F6F4CA|nr:IS200/IS605 family transposase [Moorena sp. SIO3I6]NEO60349.1 IS200/IS605 family transposase [Moorena sp. SIO4G2]NEP27754.1 IS200/IS605 family transposase [Moorena sp. SIO3I6]